MSKITPFLMFGGKAKEALDFYTSIFPKAKIENITFYGEDDSGDVGTVKLANFSLNGQSFMCIDSNAPHGFTFTPAISFYINYDSEKEIDEYFEKLSNDGQVFMPLSKYPFSEKFGWIADKFGVSWQLNLSNSEQNEI